MRKSLYDYKGIIVAAALTLVAAAVFSFFPKIDIIVSGFFYDPENGFFLRKNPFMVLIYESIEIFVPCLILFCVIGLFSVRIRKKAFWGLGYAGIIYILINLALVPGLMINGVLKEFWGRARPSTIEEFGGKLLFTPALIPSDQCQSNCSFASGHASAGFFPMALAFVFPRNKRKLMACGIVYGSLTGLARIAQGGHFFSDVVFAGLIVYTLSWFLWFFFGSRVMSQQMDDNTNYSKVS